MQIGNFNSGSKATPEVSSAGTRWRRSASLTLFSLMALSTFVFNRSVQAAEPILTLAMAKSNSRFEARALNRPEALRGSITPTHSDVTIQIENFQASDGDASVSFEAEPDWILKKRPARNRFLLALQSVDGNPDASLRTSASIQAGYGPVCADELSRIDGHNVMRWQEPSCGYVKVNFHF